MPETELTVFERCVASLEDLPIDNGEGRNAYAVGEDGRAVVRAVLTALAEYTESPRTVDEVMRVLGEG